MASHGGIVHPARFAKARGIRGTTTIWAVVRAPIGHHRWFNLCLRACGRDMARCRHQTRGPWGCLEGGLGAMEVQVYV